MAKFNAPVFNFAGIALFESGPVQWVPSGDYAVKVTDMDPKRDGSSVFIRCKIKDGPQAGKTVTRNIGLTVNEGNARAWKSLYISAGWAEASMETSFAPDDSATGRDAFVTVVSPPQAEASGKNLKMEDIDVNFIRPETYRKRLAEGPAAPAAPSGMTPSSPPPGLPPPPGAPAASAASHTAAPPPPSNSPMFGTPPNGAASAPAAGAPPPPPPQ